jgi:hypothetical protein
MIIVTDKGHNASVIECLNRRAGKCLAAAE